MTVQAPYPVASKHIPDLEIRCQDASQFHQANTRMREPLLNFTPVENSRDLTNLALKVIVASKKQAPRYGEGDRRDAA